MSDIRYRLPTLTFYWLSAVKPP
ncbi:hypothetical protein VCHC42A1_3154, partial [Vibrio cholerae HC-42A1]